MHSCVSIDLIFIYIHTKGLKRTTYKMAMTVATRRPKNSINAVRYRGITDDTNSPRTSSLV